MALAETAELAVKLTLGGNFQRQLAGVNRQLKNFDRDASRAFRAGQQIGTGLRRGFFLAAGAAGLVATQVALGLDSLVELEQQTAQTNAVIKSTGGVANITAKQIGELSEKYESLNATIGDEVIREGQNLLLTFTNIREKAFEPALAAALDMNTALGKGADGLTSTVRILGKALNDPTKGLSALTRVGITFNAEQTKRIKALQKEGDLYGAQSIILEELNKRFGGSFLAQGDTTAGKVAKFNDAIEDLQRSLATALLPTVGNIADALSDLLQDPAIIKGAEDLGREIGNLFSAKNVKEGARLIGSVFQTLRSAAPAIKTALGTVGTVLKTAFDAFTSLPLPIQQLLIGGFAVNKLTGGLVTNIAGGIFGALKAMTVQAGIVNVNGPVAGGGAGGIAGKGGGILGKATTGLSVLAAVGGIIGAFATQQEVSAQSSAQAQGVHQTATVFLGQNPTTQQLLTAMAGVDQGIADLQSNPLHMLVQGDALKTLQQTKADINQKLAAASLEIQRKGEQTVSSVDQSKQTIKSATDTVAQRSAETTRETTRGALQTQATQRSTAAAIQSTIRANRPIITVNVDVTANSYSKTVNVNSRSGPPGGSRDTHSGAKQAP